MPSPLIKENERPAENAAERMDETIYREICALAKKHHIQEIIPFLTRDICVAHWVRLKCKYGCQKYGRSWCCPPETPDPNQTRSLLGEYRKALLLCGRIRNGTFYKEDQKKRRIQVGTWKGTIALERRLFLSGYYKAFALVAESCALCKQCAYPGGCKFPVDKRPSVESCSIDIFQTLRNIGRDFTIVRDVGAEYDSYSIILLE